MKTARRAFLAGGLVLLAAPGMVAEHLDWWVIMLSGVLAGCLAAAAVGGGR